MSDWRGVSKRAVREKGGAGLLRHYPSFRVALKTIYPEHSWESSKSQTNDHKEEDMQIALELVERRIGIRKVHLVFILFIYLIVYYFYLVYGILCCYVIMCYAICDFN